MLNLKILKNFNFKNLKNYKDYFAGSFETGPQNAIGIYLAKNSATVLCLNVEGREKKLLGSFTLTVDQQQPDQGIQHLVSLLAQGCAQRGWFLSDVAVALDSVLYMQHSVHSEFTDPRQIASTVRFDTEESLSMDITDLAIAFKALAGAGEGSPLTVFTVRQKQLADIILALQANNLDPAVCEPDVASLTRFLPAVASIPDDSNSLYCLFSSRSAYFIDFAKLQQPAIMRTFLISASQDRNDVLKREIPITSGLLGSLGPIDLIRVYDSVAQADYASLSVSTGAKADSFDLIAAASIPPDCTDSIGFAVAYGAALSLIQKEQTVNFRSDFMPYEGKRVAFEKTVKTLSVSIVVLMVLLGLFLQMRIFRVGAYRSKLRQKFQQDYSIVLPGKKIERGVDPVKKLSGELRRVKDAKSGQLGPANQQTVGAKLTLVLEAFNKCASQVQLHIDSVSVSANTINIAGDTASRDSTLKLFDTLRASKLEILQQRLDQKAGRDIFSISVMPKQ